jgi:hypothetical protein
MYYDTTITVPHATLEANPVVETLKLTSGVITYAEIQFPSGTFALVHVRVFYHEHQIWPLNNEGSISADGYVVPIPDTLSLDEEPYELKVKAWSDADTYDYDIDVRVEVQRPEEIEKLSPLGGLLNKFMHLVGLGN